jgi:ligand-binding SRPBCC domain-containing protein
MRWDRIARLGKLMYEDNLKNTFTVSDSMHVNAPIERCFLLSTNIELVQETLGLKPLFGKTSGLAGPDDVVLWAGWKFGLPQMHESKITEYDRPVYFQDTMMRGRFRFYQHEHHFAEIDRHTLLQDKIRFALPLWFVGAAVSQHVIVPHVVKLLRKRFFLLKRLAEGDGWKKYIPEK